MTLQARYTILRKVADGGTAEIFLATQHGAHSFEKLVILKRIFSAFYADPQFRDMLIDEAHIAMSLNHSNIVHVLDLGEADGQYVLALELVDGWSLDAILRRSRALKTSVPPPLALYMTAEVCRALAYAHAKVGTDGNPLGIVHRDISPHNVLLSEQGEVKLTDFGIAKAHNRRESSLGNVIKGKIAYMSPEQASGAIIDARSDLFSVGTMLYVMVCSQYPFDAPTDLEMLLMVKAGAYKPPEKAMPGLNPELYRVIRRALSKAPDERYQRAEEMLMDVEQVMRVAFRAVGQTELKRWLQDLSMRDGGVPLTRTPTPPSSGGRLDGETLELKGGGTIRGVIPTVSLPPPVSSRAVGTIPTGTGSTQVGRPRPQPPTAALQVGKNDGKNVGKDMGKEETTDDSASFFEEAVELTPTPEPAAVHERQGAAHVLPPGTPHPARIDAESEPIHPGRPKDFTVAADDRPEAAVTAPSLRRSGSFDLPPSTPRKSSSWVAEAVLAAAQRAGTTPPPPIAGKVVPPPPVSSDIAISPSPAGTVTTRAPESDSAPVPGPPRRTLFVGAGLGIVAVLIIGLSARRCGGGTTQAERKLATPPVTATSRPAAAPPAPAPPKPAAVATAPSAATAAALAPSDRGPPADNIRTSVVGAAPPPTAAPVPGTGGTTAAPEPPRPPPGRGTADNASPAPLPREVKTEVGTERVAGNAPVGGDRDGDATNSTAPVEKVMVLLSSNPPGAQVSTARRQLGATPVSVKLKVGRNYALVFAREGYHPLTKQFRVTAIPDQEVVAVLRRDPSAQTVPSNVPAAPPSPAKPERNWLQRMFAP